MKRFFLFMLILVCAGTFISCDKDHEPMLLTEEVVEQEDLTQAIVGTYIGTSTKPDEKGGLGEDVNTTVEVKSVGEEKVSLTIERFASDVNRRDIEEIEEVNVSLEDEVYNLSAHYMTSDGVNIKVIGNVNGKQINFTIDYTLKDRSTTSSYIKGTRN